MKKNGLNFLGKIVVVAFFQCLIGNISAQETGVLDIAIGDFGVNTLAVDFAGSTTVEMWTRGLATEGVGKNAPLWSSKSTGGGFMAYFNGSDGMICFEWGTLRKWLSPGARDADTWMHLAFVIENKGKLTLYRDGVYAADYTPTPEEEFDYTNAGGSEKCWIGSYEWWKDLVGVSQSFADVRVWNVARTEEEIAATYQTTLPSGTPNLVINYLFMEGSPSETIVNSANSSTHTGYVLNNNPDTYAWGKVGVTPTNLAATSQTTNDFTLTWDGGIEGEWAIELLDSSWESLLDTTTTNSITISGLEEGAYRASVRAIWPFPSAYSEEISIIIGASGIAEQSAYKATIISEGGTITLKNLEGNNDICVYNAAGTLLHQSKSTNTSYSIDAASWGTGVYFVNVKNGLKTKNFKIVL